MGYYSKESIESKSLMAKVFLPIGLGPRKFFPCKNFVCFFFSFLSYFNSRNLNSKISHQLQFTPPCIWSNSNMYVLKLKGNNLIIFITISHVRLNIKLTYLNDLVDVEQ